MVDNTTESPSPRNRIRRFLRWFLRSEYFVLVIVLLAIGIAMSAITEGFAFSFANIENIFVQSSVRGIAAIGQFLCILTAGIDLSVGGTAIFIGNIGGTFMTEDMTKNILGYSLSPYLGVPLLLIIGSGIGAFSGFAVSRIRMPALIVTLAIWQIVTTFTFKVSRGFQVLHMPEALAFAGQGELAGVPMPIIIFIAIVVIFYFLMHYTTYGRSLYAIGGNPTSAWLSGVKVKLVQFSAYLISGLLAAASGALQLSRIMATSPQMVKGLELDTIAAVTIGGVSLAGGRGTIIGVFLGVLIIGALNNSLNLMALDPTYNFAIKGVIIFLAVAVDSFRRR